MAVTGAFEQHVKEIITAAEGGRTSRDKGVVDSWLRCLNDYKLDPEHKGEARIVSEQVLKEHQQEAEDLLSVARFGMEDLYRRVNSMGYVLLLTDADGVTVDFIGDEKVDRELKRAGLYIGSEWSEREAGTCGVGACLTTGEAITIHQSDHFDMAHTPLSCTAAPIYNPTGKMVGVLDVSLLMSPSEKYSQALTLEVVKSCVRRIELANLMASRKDEWILRLNATSEFLGVDPN
uniref:sigma-54-dependent Fis family transcriptional regulator n=1 Tax=Actibacterium sp. TaxID=1872125 RepID=UPI0035661608